MALVPRRVVHRLSRDTVYASDRAGQFVPFELQVEPQAALVVLLLVLVYTPAQWHWHSHRLRLFLVGIPGVPVIRRHPGLGVVYSVRFL